MISCCYLSSPLLFHSSPYHSKLFNLLSSSLTLADSSSYTLHPSSPPGKVFGSSNLPHLPFPQRCFSILPQPGRPPIYLQSSLLMRGSFRKRHRCKLLASPHPGVKIYSHLPGHNTHLRYRLGILSSSAPYCAP